MEYGLIDRRGFLKLAAAVPVVGLGTQLQLDAKGEAATSKLPQEWIYGNNEFKTPRLLSETTHRLAQEALTGQWGQRIKNASFSLSDADIAGLSLNGQYAKATMAVSRNAPVWIMAGSLLVGSATLSEARGHVTPLMTNYSSVSHTTIGFDKVLRVGYKGLRAKIEERLSRGGLDSDGQDLLRSMLTCLDAAKVWHGRYMEELERRIAASEGHEQQTYVKVRNALRNVPENPPSTFHEAVQSLRFVFAFQKLMGNWSGVGRVDDMLGSFLKKDLSEGRITLDEAREIVAHFWILGSEWTTTLGRGSGDAQHYQNVILGGIDAQGREVTNEVTYLVLDIIEELHISDFPIAVRVNRNTSGKLYQRIAQVQRHGGGIVAMYNEDVVIEGLLKFGYPVEEARTFTNDGCWEVLIPGQTAFIYRPNDMLQIMQESLGLNGGPKMDDALSFEDVYAKFVSSLEGFYKSYIESAALAWQDKAPCPLLSILVDDCIERGRAYNNRGAKYSVCSPHMGGMADVANSFLAIKTLVYEQKVLKLTEFVDVVQADWAGYEHLRTMVLSRIEGYGNNSEKADAMMKRVFNDYTRIVAMCREKNGVLMPAGISTFGREIEWLPVRQATFSGHRKGDILATNFSPTPGSDIKGPTSAVNSYCRMDYTQAPGGATLELKIHPASVQGENGCMAMVGLLKTFQKQGGWYLHVDVVDSALLLDAQRHPEKYQNLPVRIAGWSARFGTLDKKWQDMVIGRTQQIL